ncbi:regulator of G protein signaling domain-containing protein [Boeremia exigua]|uniref:regulator of G protein signaling domain-containing protein n=1 Tax=Boeremia exigua TaxID=749465 RepID=UPI001E8E52FD|nr:regulator of G protein signaling domain-containing protein [Boeremia exigua]KAH6639741.1 regulator of G protein signaling domain-containing protein [Boeremia exigua]
MPLTTPFLPLTVSAASLSSSNSSHIGETLDTGPDSDEPQLRFDLEALSAVSEACATTTAQTATTPPAARSNSRRLTFTRFPLLRKGSRELTRATHFRGSSISAAAPPSRADSPFLSTGAPRASRTSFARGRTELPLFEPSRAREPSVSASLRSGSISAEEPGPYPDRKNTSLSQAAQFAKMHQTSSRLLRMTDDERPYTRVTSNMAFNMEYSTFLCPRPLHLVISQSKLHTIADFKDLFSTLMVSLPLTAHRVRFRMIDYTFSSDEAITNLGSLKFSQSNRMPDPKDSSRVVTTTTTTTFSMAKEMARSVCQKFLEAKFVESVEGKTDFTNKSSVWQLTPKGIHILERFCTRNGIQSAHVKAVIESNRNPHLLVILERNTENDKLHHDEQTVEILFRRFIGTTANETASDSDSIHEFSKCDIGVKLVKHRPTTSRQYEYTFNGRNAAQWLMDCTTMVDPRESIEIGSLFLQLKLIAPVDPRVPEHTFQPVKQVHYYVTPHGERVAGWSLEEIPSSGEAVAAKTRDGMARDSNSNRTNVIIRNPSWRLLYREFLKETMCEENLSFYLEVQEFNRQYRAATGDKGDNKVETIRETLAAAYGLYNAFLAPGSPNELNIDHGLRTQLATRMTRAVGDDAAMLQSLNEVATLFDKAQNSIFKLMSSDSVPKFVKHPKYAPQLRGLDAAAASSYAALPAGSR